MHDVAGGRWHCCFTAARRCAASRSPSLIGIVFGTYSSIYIATAITLWLKITPADFWRRRRKPSRSTRCPDTGGSSRGAAPAASAAPRCTFGAPAMTLPVSRWSPGVRLVTMPPASRIISEPAAMSQTLSPNSQKPSSLAGGDVAEIQRGRARAAHAGRVLHHRLQHRHVLRQPLGVAAVGEAGADERAFQPGPGADPHAPPVHLGAATASRGEQLLAAGVVDDAHLELVADLQGDRHREHGKAVQEIGGAVERVDDPHELVARVVPAFLGQEAVVRIALADAVDDRRFRGEVHLGHELVARLGADVEIGDTVQVAQCGVAALACGLYGRVQQCLHVAVRHFNGLCPAGNPVPVAARGAIVRRGCPATHLVLPPPDRLARIHGPSAAIVDRQIAMTSPSVRFVLFEPTHPGNIGASARAIKTMGFRPTWRW